MTSSLWCVISLFLEACSPMLVMVTSSSPCCMVLCGKNIIKERISIHSIKFGFEEPTYPYLWVACQCFFFVLVFNRIILLIHIFLLQGIMIPTQINSFPSSAYNGIYLLVNINPEYITLHNYSGWIHINDSSVCF